MTSIMLVDSTQGKRVFLLIQNQQIASLTGESGIVGIAFDQVPQSVAQCPIKLYPGGSIMFDKTVPQNRIFALSDQPFDCPIGVVVSNLAV